MSVVRSLAYQLLRALDALLQLCVPPLRNRICYASIPDFTDNAYYLFRHALRSRPGLEHVWLVHDPAVAGRIGDEFARLTRYADVHGHSLRVLPWRSLAGYWAFLRSRHVVHTHGVHNFSRAAIGRIRLGLWHGMPIKCIGRLNTVTPNPNPPYATHYIATSHFFRYVLAQAFGVAPNRVLVTGQPRNDALVFDEQRAQTPAAIRSALGLSNCSRTLVWLPTYRAEGPWLEPKSRIRSFVDDVPADMLKQFSDSARKADCAVLIKLHPFEQSDVHAALAHVPNLRLISDAEWQKTGVQLYDLLGIADGLVSDVSSVLIDFAVTGKPLACFGFSSESYTRDLVFPLQYLIDAANIQILDDHTKIAEFFERLGKAEAPKPFGTTRVFIHRTDIPASEAILDFLNDPAATHGRTSDTAVAAPDPVTEKK